MENKYKIWGKLTKSAYCNVDELPSRLVEVELPEEVLGIIVFERLKKLGVPITKCSKCKLPIVFLKTKNGKDMPTCLNLTSHFADCKFAKDFRKSKSVSEYTPKE